MARTGLGSDQTGAPPTQSGADSGADTSLGIAPGKIERVLQAFGQVESAMSRKYDGTGLGLSLTKALVELHGGRLELETTFGKGITVSACFPKDRIISA